MTNLSTGCTSLPRILVRVTAGAVGCALVLGALASESIPVVLANNVQILGSARSIDDIRAKLNEKFDNAFTVSSRDEVVTVGTCEDLFAADGKGVNIEGFGYQPYRFRALACYADKAIVDAKPARVSYLKGFGLSRSSVRKLPVDVAFVISPENQRRVDALKEKGGTLGDVLRDIPIRVPRNKDHNYVIVNDLGGNQKISLLARGDFNNDGLEDVLLALINGEGKYVQYGLYAISRVSPDGQLEVVRCYPVMGP